MNEKLMINANLLRKESEFRTKSCVAEKTIAISHTEFLNLKQNPLRDNELIAENVELMYCDSNDIYHCLLIYDEDQGDGLLIESEGMPYARYDLCDGKLMINEAQAEIVREIFNMFLSGNGYQRISEICSKKYFKYKEKFSFYGISYILSNEKYIGDSVYQKTFTTNNLPFKKMKNNGQLNKYHIQNTHEAIISKEVFEKTQALIESRKHNNITSEYAFKGRIICAVCGSKYKRKICRSKSFWVCRKHDNLAGSCDSKRLTESSIVEAFLRLNNKLQSNYKQILVPLQMSLRDLKLRQFSGNSNVMEIHKEIAKLKEQTHVLARLKTKGFLDNTKFLEQTTELTAKINKLQSELKKITHLDDEDETLDQIDMLIDYFEKQDAPISEFDESAFKFLINKIVVTSQNELEFHVMGGLKFKEKIF